MQDEVAEYTRQQIYRLSQQKDKVEVLELNVQPDHVHLVVSIPRSAAPISVCLLEKFGGGFPKHIGRWVWFGSGPAGVTKPADAFG